jgi:hypothetical protein
MNILGEKKQGMTLGFLSISSNLLVHSPFIPCLLFVHPLNFMNILGEKNKG